MTSPSDQQSLVLPNGLKVVLLERPFGNSFTACLNFRAGSQKDPSNKMGLAHLTEHLAFTGHTRVLSRKLSEQSVYVNASTAQQRTAFYVSGHSDFLDDGLRLLGSILETQDIDSEACRHERQIVYQEMVDDERNSLNQRTVAYWKLLYRLSGDPNWQSNYQQRMATVLRLTNTDVNGFRKAFYRLDNAALAIVAPRGLGELRRMIDDLFGAIICDAAPSTWIVEPCAWQEASELNFHYDRWPNIWVGMINTAPDAKVITRLAANVLTHHLGGGEHSEMFGRFREDSSAAYNAATEYDCWIGHTSIRSFVSINKKSALDALKFLVERAQQFVDEGIDSKQLECLIERNRRWWEMRMENHYNLADFLSFEALRPEGTSMIDVRPNSDVFEATTAEQFSAAARRLFDPHNRKIFVGGRIGPLGRWKIHSEISSG